MPDVYFNKHPNKSNRNGGQNRRSDYDNYEDISSYSSNYRADEFDVPSDYDDYSRRRSAASQQQRQSQKSRQQQYDRQQQHRGYQQPAPDRRKKKKRSGCGNKFLSILLVLVLLYIGTGYLVFGKMDVDKSQHKSNQYVSAGQLKDNPLVTNILLLGVDAREGETVSRADTMMLVSIDRVHSKIKLTSFLRDSYVQIPGHERNKLNASTSEGGIQLTIDTIEYNYGINIDKYMAVNFQAFTNLIDALGGVDVAITSAEANYLNNTWYKWSLTGNKLTFQSGDKVHLNGEEALMFCRIRKLDSDVQRTRRQREVISAIKEEMSAVSPSDLIKIAKTVMPEIQTDIGWLRMENMSATALIAYRHFEIQQTSLPVDGTWHSEYTNAGDSVVFDINSAAQTLKNFIYKNEDPTEA